LQIWEQGEHKKPSNKYTLGIYLGESQIGRQNW